jgi:hypothetical protein
VVNSKQKDKKSELWKRNIYKKGDAVISYCKDDLGKTVCKRVAALEGERVSYRGNGMQYMSCSCTMMYCFCNVLYYIILYPFEYKVLCQ